jgi:hypothetical protein
MLMIAFAISPFWVATLHIREFLVMASMTTHTTMNIQEQSAGSMVEIAALFLMLVIIAIFLPWTGHLSQEGVTLIFSLMPWVWGGPAVGVFLYGADIFDWITIVGILQWLHHFQEYIFKNFFMIRKSCSHIVECIVNNSEPK